MGGVFSCTIFYSIAQSHLTYHPSRCLFSYISLAMWSLANGPFFILISSAWRVRKKVHLQKKKKSFIRFWVFTKGLKGARIHNGWNFPFPFCDILWISEQSIDQLSFELPMLAKTNDSDNSALRRQVTRLQRENYQHVELCLPIDLMHRASQGRSRHHEG